MKVIGISLMFTGMWFAIATWANTPVVYKSATTKQCVKVVIDGEECPCEHLPDTYETVWVQ